MGCLVGIILELIGIVVMFKGCASAGNSGDGAGLIIFGLLLIGSAAVPLSSYLNNQQKEKREKLNEYEKDNIIPDNAFIVKYINGLEYVDNLIAKNMSSKPLEYYLWKEDNFIKVVSRPEDPNLLIHTFKIKFDLNINKVISFGIIGDAYTETNVTGGGSSIGGAISGGVVAGGVGAIVGSRKKIETENKRIDKRKTLVMYKENNVIKSIFFSPETYEILLKLIPEKDSRFIKNKVIIDNKESDVNILDGNNENDVYEQIRKLSKLKDDGILTEEEFNEKKKVFLDKIK